MDKLTGKDYKKNTKSNACFGCGKWLKPGQGWESTYRADEGVPPVNMRDVRCDKCRPE